MSMFTTIEDARTYYENSGVYGWEWFKGFEEKELISFIWACGNDDSFFTKTYFREEGHENHDPEDYDIEFNFDEVVKQFLIKKGQNIEHYGY